MSTNSKVGKTLRQLKKSTAVCVKHHVSLKHTGRNRKALSVDKCAPKKYKRKVRKVHDKAYRPSTAVKRWNIESKGLFLSLLCTFEAPATTPPPFCNVVSVHSGNSHNSPLSTPFII